jgi:hypothetical protein
MCTAETAHLPLPPAFGLIYTRAPLVSQDGRHLFITQWYAYMRMASLTKDILGACSVEFLIKREQSESSTNISVCAGKADAYLKKISVDTNLGACVLYL